MTRRRSSRSSESLLPDRDRSPAALQTRSVRRARERRLLRAWRYGAGNTEWCRFLELSVRKCGRLGSTRGRDVRFAARACSAESRRLGRDPRRAVAPDGDTRISQAGHATAPDQCCKTSESSCKAPSTRDPKRTSTRTSPSWSASRSRSIRNVRGE